jgi:hypothetical protein
MLFFAAIILGHTDVFGKIRIFHIVNGQGRGNGRVFGLCINGVARIILDLARERKRCKWTDYTISNKGDKDCT